MLWRPRRAFLLPEKPSPPAWFWRKETAFASLRVLAFLALGVCGGVAAVIPGLFPTGVSDQGTLLSAGAVDPHYRLVQSADPAAAGPNAYVVVDGGFPIPPWAGNGPKSKWIAPQAGQSTGNQPGDYRYRLTFDLTGFEPATAVISGVWSSDNTGTQVLLNGVGTGISNDGNFGVLASSFKLATGFVEGTNTLDFVVNNATTSVSPTGVRVELSGTADLAAPPGTPPSVLTPPASQAVAPGDSAGFSVRATGARPLAYQWRRNAVPIAGATGTLYTIASAGMADVAAYDVVVTNAWGAATSSPAATLVLRSPSPAELSYEPPGPSSRRTGIAITEILYHPASRADGRDIEFIELYNSNPFPEDLSGYRLSGAWEYTFPDGTAIAGLGYRVVAANPADLQAVYGLTGVLGGITNRLPNDTGTIRLCKRSGGIVLEVEYADQPPWPAAADGAGHSLVLARPSLGEKNPRAWAASAAIGGSPGGADPVPGGPLENVVINEVLAHTDPPLFDYVELYNHSPLPVDLSGCVLTDDPATNKCVIPPGTTLAASGFVYFTRTNLGFALDAAGETVYFKNPAGTRVVDAVRFGAQEHGVSMGRSPDGADEFYRLQATTPGTTNASILQEAVGINELMYHPLSEDDDDQYVELYNCGVAAADLGGWRLEGGLTFQIPDHTVIPAGGYLVIGRKAARLLANYPNLNAANTVGDFSGRLAHGGERVVLSKTDWLISTNELGLRQTNTLHVAVDEVTYGTGGRWGQWADGGGSSLELIDPRNPHRLAANWADSDESGKSAWTTIETTGVLDLGHPSVPTAEQLQLMLLGAGEALVDNVQAFVPGEGNRLANAGFETGTGGWFFQGTHRLTGWETNGGYGSSRSLHVRASGRGNQVVDRVRAPFTSAFATGQVATIRAQARWLCGWPEMLLRFKGGTLEAAGRLSVPAGLGTPGARNSRARANAGPAICEVTHRPVLPQANQAVRVVARVEDADGVASVRLRYRVDPATNVTAVTMSDTGTNGDAVAGDGVYTGVIPAQPSGTLVVFWIEAADGFAPPASTLFPADAPARACLVRFGETVPVGAYGTYRFWVTQAVYDFWSAREKMSGEDVDATFVYGTNRVIYNLGARYGGSPYTAPGYTTPTGALCGYSLDFPPDDALLGDTRIVLDWPVRDSTDQKEQLMFWFLDQFGLPNNYRRYIRLYVNGVERGTIYDDVQRPGSDMIHEWFAGDSEGSLFKTDVWDEFDDAGDRIGSLIYLNSLENVTTTGGVKKTAYYRWCWEPRVVRGSANDFSDLFTLIDAANAPSNGYQAAVEGIVDVGHWMKTFCMNDLASYWDGFGNPNAKNTYLYKPQHAPWKLMSWDFDVGLGTFNDPVDAPLFPTLNDPVMMRLEAYPAFARGYWCALDQALNTFFKTGSGTALEALLDAKYAAFQSNGIALTSPDPIKTWISQRRAFLQGQLGAVAASFAVNGTNDVVTNRNLIVLSGTAPVTVQTIVVNGIAWPVIWTELTAWQMLVPVTNGAVTLDLQGLDYRGLPLAGAARSVTVNYTGPEVRPERAVVINEIMSRPARSGAEYVELLNRSTNLAFDVSGWRVHGLDYTFPSGSVLTNQQLVVLARDRAAFGAAYGWDIPVAAEYGGTLQPDGETLALARTGTNAADEIELSAVRYEGRAPWPSGADGTGSSFQLIDPAQDNWRAGNWAAVPTNTQSVPLPQWVYFATNGVASSSVVYIYLLGAGELYLDDLRLVAGSVPEQGVNLLTNGGFESGVAGTWLRTANFVQSVPSTNVAHSGSYSLRVVATGSGSGNGNGIYQIISPALVANQPYALSFWYLQSTNPASPALMVRLSGSGITSGSINPVAPTTPVLVAPATPGAPNSTLAGLPAFPPLWLNELQAENLAGITNRAGQRAPWVELFNPSTNTVSLEGLFLANNYSNLTQWAFPAGAAIGPGELKVIFADGQTNLSTLPELHAGFVLTPGSGQLALSRLYRSQPQVLDYLDYSGLRPNRSLGSLPDGQSFRRQEFYYVSPGASNNAASAPLAVFINEWMADNTQAVADPADSDYEDWFELYNPGTNAVDLGGCYLTDALTNKFQFQVPQTGQYSVPPGGFLLVWADGESKQNSTNRSDLHVNFKLDKGGEAIFLFAPDSSLVDGIAFGPQDPDISEGRFPDGASTCFRMPTPTAGRANTIPNTPPTLGPVSDQYVYAGQTLRIRVSAADAEQAVQQLRFSLDAGAPSGATVDAVTGWFVWPVPVGALPAAHGIIVRVTDNGTPPLSGAAAFRALVQAVPQMDAQPLAGLVRLRFAGVPGQSYQVQFTEHLEDPVWKPLSAVLSGTGTVLEVDDSASSGTARFYRLQITR